MTKSNWGGKGLFQLNNSQVLLDQGGKSRQEEKQTEVMEEPCSPACFPWLPQPVLFLFSRQGLTL